MTYSAPWWLPGGHAQTMYPAICIAKPEVAYRRERWDTPDGDFIDVDFVDGKPGHPFLVLFHGLEGSSASHYARATMAHAAALGWSAAVPHFRGCSGEMNLAPRFYHSGDAPEIDWILRRFDACYGQQDGSKLYAAGVSLGANALLRWLGESQHAADFVDAACAISSPLDLTGAGTALGCGINRLYSAGFLQSLKPKCILKLAQFPGLFDRDKMLNANSLYDFDDAVTAPVHGYRDANDYWTRASSKLVLNDITVPTLVLNAANDPFLPARYLPDAASRFVTLEFPTQGGHAGFTAGAIPGSLNWLPERMVQFLEGAHQVKEQLRDRAA